ncbi:MAG: hypothetical protein KKD28_10530, partial [Chloroflexi bacterium]|nr:hypothetical protein [Chloroflexota bacterium]
MTVTFGSDIVPSSISVPDKTVAATETPEAVETKSESPELTLSVPTNISPVTSFGGGNNGLQPSAAQVGE